MADFENCLIGENDEIRTLVLQLVNYILKIAGKSYIEPYKSYATDFVCKRLVLNFLASSKFGSIKFLNNDETIELIVDSDIAIAINLLLESAPNFEKLYDLLRSWDDILNDTRRKELNPILSILITCHLLNSPSILKNCKHDDGIENSLTELIQLALHIIIVSLDLINSTSSPLFNEINDHVEILDQLITKPAIDLLIVSSRKISDTPSCWNLIFKKISRIKHLDNLLISRLIHLYPQVIMQNYSTICSHLFSNIETHVDLSDFIKFDVVKFSSNIICDGQLGELSPLKKWIEIVIKKISNGINLNETLISIKSVIEMTHLYITSTEAINLMKSLKSFVPHCCNQSKLLLIQTLHSFHVFGHLSNSYYKPLLKFALSFIVDFEIEQQLPCLNLIGLVEIIEPHIMFCMIKRLSLCSDFIDFPNEVIRLASSFKISSKSLADMRIGVKLYSIMTSSSSPKIIKRSQIKSYKSKAAQTLVHLIIHSVDGTILKTRLLESIIAYAIQEEDSEVIKLLGHESISENIKKINANYVDRLFELLVSKQSVQMRIQTVHLISKSFSYSRTAMSISLIQRIRPLLSRILASIKYGPRSLLNDNVLVLEAILMTKLIPNMCIRVYIQPILEILITNLPYCEQILYTIEFFLPIGPDIVEKYVDQLIAASARSMGWQTARSYRFLANLILHCSIDPVILYDLQRIILEKLVTVTDTTLQIELLRLVGSIGATDPKILFDKSSKIVKNISKNDQNFVVSDDEDDVEEIHNETYGVCDPYLPKIITYLMSSTLTEERTTALVRILAAYGVKMAPFILKTILLPEFLDVYKPYSVSAVTSVVIIAGLHIRPHFEAICEFVIKILRNKYLCESGLFLIIQLCEAMKGERLAKFSDLFKSVIEILRITLHPDLALLSLRCLIALCEFLDQSHQFIVLQALCDLDIETLPIFDELVSYTIDIFSGNSIDEDILNTIANRFNTFQRNESNSDKILTIVDEEIQRIIGFNFPISTKIFQPITSLFWDNTECKTTNDWHQWLAVIEKDLVKHNPNPSIRACSSISKNFSIFQISFLSFVSYDNESLTTVVNNLYQHLEFALKFSPVEVALKIINLAEYMHRNNHPIPVSLRVLADSCSRCMADAKALFWEEELLRVNERNPSIENTEALINTNSALLDTEAAMGILELAILGSLDVEISWYEKLHCWDEAIERYANRALSFISPGQDPFDEALKDSVDYTECCVGMVRCWNALGKWKDAEMLTKSILPLLNTQQLSVVSPIAANASWSLQNWDSFHLNCTYVDPNSFEGAFFNSISAALNANIRETERQISKARSLIALQISTNQKDRELKVEQFYKESYSQFVQLQMLSEIEESVYILSDSSTDTNSKNLDSKTEKLNANFDYCHRPANELIKRAWNRRIDYCALDQVTWLNILRVHSMALEPESEAKRRIKLAGLCAEEGKSSIAELIFSSLLSCDLFPSTSLENDGLFARQAKNLNHAETLYSYLKYRWYHCCVTLDDRCSVLRHLDFLVVNLRSNENQNRLLARCYHKLGTWTQQLDGNDNFQRFFRSEEFLLLSTSYDGEFGKAWRAWALINLKLAESPLNSAERKSGLMIHQNSIANKNMPPELENTPTNKSSRRSADHFGRSEIHHHKQQYIISAIQGLLRSLSLENDSPSYWLQDALKILTLWFQYGPSDPAINAVIADGLPSVSLKVWLQVVPQLIARIACPAPHVRRLVHRMLSDLARFSAHELVYPLVVASKAQSMTRRTAALALLDGARSHSARLVEETLLLSEELVQIAVLWEDRWYEGLEEASRLYYVDRDFSGMLTVLDNLYKQTVGRVLSTASDSIDSIFSTLLTPHEINFVNIHGKDLKEARDFCVRFKREHFERDLESAWERYSVVFKRLSRKIMQKQSLNLADISPRLFGLQNMLIGVPGHHETSIASFSPRIYVIASKQRPRRIKIRGADGNLYQFLLKGQEDLRQDERVMQLFYLINTLLKYNSTKGLGVRLPFVAPKKSSAKKTNIRVAQLVTEKLYRAENISSVENDGQTPQHEGEEKIKIQGTKLVRNLTANLEITRFPVIPLSQTTGLIGWLKSYDTLHVLIHDWREKNDIPISMEHKEIVRLTSDGDNLPIIKKVEAFEAALKTSEGRDLALVMWNRCLSAEEWQVQRSTFVRSLATSSMVGYILGLGDRHPSNLMIDRKTGQIAHIDFGDCFEVAMRRKRFPETVPFRLTRMLVKTMDASGLVPSGPFFSTCVKVMQLLRSSKDSLMNVLEAFVYDPLINWRLVVQDQNALFECGVNASRAKILEHDTLVKLVDESSTRKRHNEFEITRFEEETINRPDLAHEGAVNVISRVGAKLSGLETHNGFYSTDLYNRTVENTDQVSSKDSNCFNENSATNMKNPQCDIASVQDQVHRLIAEATSTSNLSQAYVGWCSFW